MKTRINQFNKFFILILTIFSGFIFKTSFCLAADFTSIASNIKNISTDKVIVTDPQQSTTSAENGDIIKMQVVLQNTSGASTTPTIAVNLPTGITYRTGTLEVFTANWNTQTETNFTSTGIILDNAVNNAEVISIRWEMDVAISSGTEVITFTISSNGDTTTIATLKLPMAEIQTATSDNQQLTLTLGSNAKDDGDQSDDLLLVTNYTLSTDGGTTFTNNPSAITKNSDTNLMLEFAANTFTTGQSLVLRLENISTYQDVQIENTATDGRYETATFIATNSTDITAPEITNIYLKTKLNSNVLEIIFNESMDGNTLYAAGLINLMGNSLGTAPSSMWMTTLTNNDTLYITLDNDYTVSLGDTITIDTSTTSLNDASSNSANGKSAVVADSLATDTFTLSGCQLENTIYYCSANDTIELTITSSSVGIDKYFVNETSTHPTSSNDFTGVNSGTYNDNQSFTHTLQNENETTRYFYAWIYDDGSQVLNSDTNANANKITFVYDKTSPTITFTANQTATNATGQTVKAQSNESNGKIYLILDGESQTSINDFETAIAANKGASADVTAASSDINISTENLTAGNYYAYTADAASNISSKSTEFATITSAVNTSFTDIACKTLSTTSLQITWKTTTSTEDNKVLYGTSSGNLINETTNSATSNTSHQSTISGLSENTIYYFQAQSAGSVSSENYCTTARSVPMSVDSDITAKHFYFGSGNSKTITGTSGKNLTLQSEVSNFAEFSLPVDLTITSSGSGTWSGLFLGPNETNDPNAVTITNVINDDAITATVLETISLGHDDYNLSFSENITTKIKVSNATSGDMLYAFYSHDQGTTWQEYNPSINCTVTADLFCSFSLPHYSMVTAIEKTTRICTADDWETGEWGDCNNGTKTRSVSRKNSCTGEVGKPDSSEDCTDTSSGGGGGGSGNGTVTTPYNLPSTISTSPLELENRKIALPSSGIFTREITLTNTRANISVTFPLETKVKDIDGELYDGIISYPFSFLKSSLPLNLPENVEFVTGFSIEGSDHIFFDQDVTVNITLPNEHKNNQNLKIYYYNIDDEKYEEISSKKISFSEDKTSLIILLNHFSKFVIANSGSKNISTENNETEDNENIISKKLPTDSKNHWAKNYLQKLFNRGILSGDGKTGQLRPDDNLNRAEAVKMITTALQEKTTTCQSKPFIDVDNTIWFCPFVALTKEKGWVGGYYNGRLFLPDNFITRAESLKILLFASGIKEEDFSNNNEIDFSDVPLESWYFKIIKYAKENEIVSGYSDKTFKPDNSITRAEFSKILAEVMNY